MTRGLPLFLACCFLPAFLVATEPGRFVGLALVGLFAPVVVLAPARGRR